MQARTPAHPGGTAWSGEYEITHRVMLTSATAVPIRPAAHCSSVPETGRAISTARSRCHFEYPLQPRNRHDISLHCTLTPTMHVHSTASRQLTGQSASEHHHQVTQPAQWNTNSCAYPSPRRLHGTPCPVCAGRGTFPLRNLLNRTLARLLHEICRSLPLQVDAHSFACGLPSQPNATETPALFFAACHHTARSCLSHLIDVLARSFASHQSCQRNSPMGNALTSSNPFSFVSQGLPTCSSYEVPS